MFAELKSIPAKVLGNCCISLLKKIYIFKDNELEEIPRYPPVIQFWEDGLS